MDRRKRGQYLSAGRHVDITVTMYIVGGGISIYIVVGLNESIAAGCDRDKAKGFWDSGGTRVQQG